MLISFCKPSCKYWEDKLKRCESKLAAMEHADPELSCMYPMRDWVTCVEGCVQPRIHEHLKGQETGFLS
jgi:ubiquinol-cytochrome c reductase subunit 6